MALLFRTPLFSLSLPPYRAFLGPKASFRFSAVGAAAKSGAAILWYKHDLRVEDHPGLVAASQHRTIVPLYVFDRRILSRKLICFGNVHACSSECSLNYSDVWEMDANYIA